jgi:hypothetical protein
VSERLSVGFILAGLLAVAGAAIADEPPITDPTIAPGADFVAADPMSGLSLRLHSTQVSGSSRSAVINDRIVTPGSKVGGATVVSIEPGRVQLRKGTALITLQMPLPNIKRPAGGDKS